jgi:hypothetical protein
MTLTLLLPPLKNLAKKRQKQGLRDDLTLRSCKDFCPANVAAATHDTIQILD